MKNHVPFQVSLTKLENHLSTPWKLLYSRSKSSDRIQLIVLEVNRNTHLVTMVDLTGSHPLHSNVSGSHPESSSPGWGPFQGSKWLGPCLYNINNSDRCFSSCTDRNLAYRIESLWESCSHMFQSTVLVWTLGSHVKMAKEIPQIDISTMQRELLGMKHRSDIWKQQRSAFVQWPNTHIPDLSAPSGGSWVSWLSSHAMKSLGSLSSLLFLLSSVGVLLSQLGLSSGLSFRSRESSPVLCFAVVSSPSFSSLSRLKP